MIYSPAEDSFLIEKEVLNRARGKRVLDMGSGSGILALAAIEAGASEVLCVDIDSESVEFLSRKGLSVVKSDLFERIEGKWDLIVFNPPYLPADLREDLESGRITSGGKKGDEIIVRFLNHAGKYLNDNGKILIVVSSLTPLERIKKTLWEKDFVYEKIAEKKIFMEGLEVWEIRRKIYRL